VEVYELYEWGRMMSAGGLLFVVCKLGCRRGWVLDYLQF
jgi:hypothetical protein